MGDIHLGLSYISASLRARGHVTKLVVLCSQMERGARKLAREAIEKFRPQMAGFTSVASQYPFISRMAQYVRAESPATFLVAGGSHVSLNPDECIGDAFDALCIGEGEYPMAELADQMQSGKCPEKIANLWIKRDDGSIERNRPRAFIEDIDALPFPDREIWLDWVKEDAVSQHVVLLGRGCPFDCAYCSNHALRKLAAGRYVRFRSPEGITNEIKALNRDYPGKDTVYLQAETIGLDKGWLKNLCRGLNECNATLKKPVKLYVTIGSFQGFSTTNCLSPLNQRT